MHKDHLWALVSLLPPWSWIFRLSEGFNQETNPEYQVASGMSLKFFTKLEIQKWTKRILMLTDIFTDMPSI